MIRWVYLVGGPADGAHVDVEVGPSGNMVELRDAEDQLFRWHLLYQTPRSEQLYVYRELTGHATYQECPVNDLRLHLCNKLQTILDQVKIEPDEDDIASEIDVELDGLEWLDELGWD